MKVSTMDPGFRDSWRRAALVSLAVLVLAGIVVALVGSGGRSGSDDDATATSGASEGMAFDAAEEASPATTVAATGESGLRSVEAQDDGGAGGSVTRAPLAGGGPRIIMTGALQVRVRGDVTEAIERARGIATSAGGFVASSSTSTFEKGRGSGEITLRVPADRFDDVRRRLEKLGTVRSSESSGQDVGGQLVDLGARLRTLRAEEGALGTLLGNATDIGQILQVRDRLTGVRTEIEQLAGQQAALEDQVAYATLQVSLHEAGAPAPKVDNGDDESTFASSFGTAVDAFVAVIGGMVIVVGAVLPFALLAAIGWGIWLVLRRRMAAA